MYISDMKATPARSSLSPAERDLRSRISQLVHDRWLLHATLAPRARRCGRPNCRCARGEPHVSLYLVQTRQGQGRQLFVPKDWEPRVRQAVADYQHLQQLLDQVSEHEWKRLQSRREK
jgi:hypothetical protein